MAYVSQEKKAKIAAKVKPLLAKYGLKGTLSVNHHSTIVLTLSKGKINFMEAAAQAIEQSTCGSRDRWKTKEEQAAELRNAEYLDVNVYHISSHYTGEAREALLALKEALDTDNFDNSDIMTDYFHVGHYVDINIGKWGKPYVITE